MCLVAITDNNEDDENGKRTIMTLRRIHQQQPLYGMEAHFTKLANKVALIIAQIVTCFRIKTCTLLLANLLIHALAMYFETK